jgi:hypothetical protein
VLPEAPVLAPVVPLIDPPAQFVPLVPVVTALFVEAPVEEPFALEVVEGSALPLQGAVVEAPAVPAVLPALVVELVPVVPLELACGNVDLVPALPAVPVLFIPVLLVPMPFWDVEAPVVPVLLPDCPAVAPAPGIAVVPEVPDIAVDPVWPTVPAPTAPVEPAPVEPAAEPPIPDPVDPAVCAPA